MEGGGGGAGRGRGLRRAAEPEAVKLGEPLSLCEPQNKMYLKGAQRGLLSKFFQSRS